MYVYTYVHVYLYTYMWFVHGYVGRLRSKRVVWNWLQHESMC
jgi:hypothetical protein